MVAIIIISKMTVAAICYNFILIALPFGISISVKKYWMFA